MVLSKEPQEKLKTMLMQNFGVTNKEHYGMLWYFWSGQLNVVHGQVQKTELTKTYNKEGCLAS